MGEILYSYERIEGKEIIIRELKGEISATEMIDSFKFLIDYKITKDCVGILTDTSGAKFRFSIRQFSKIILFLKRSKKLKTLKLAIIVNTPDKIIFPMIAGKKIPFLKIRPFSGEKAALKWMLE